MFHPYCDYIINKRGLFYIQRILKESNQGMFERVLSKEKSSGVLVRKARQKYEITGEQKIKHIYFVKAGKKDLDCMNAYPWNHFFRVIQQQNKTWTSSSSQKSFIFNEK